MKIVGTDALEVERALIAGPGPGCAGELRPWSHARSRVLRRGGAEDRRRPRRARCVGCRITHVLLGEDTLLRRRDHVEVIGAALAAKARGQGRRRSAAALGVHVSTVRNWLRRFASEAEAVRAFFTTPAHRLDPMLAALAPTASAVADAVVAVAVAARTAVQRFGPRPPWSFASAASGGRLLGNTSWLYPNAG